MVLIKNFWCIQNWKSGIYCRQWGGGRNQVCYIRLKCIFGAPHKMSMYKKGYLLKMIWLRSDKNRVKM